MGYKRLREGLSLDIKVDGNKAPLRDYLRWHEKCVIIAGGDTMPQDFRRINIFLLILFCYANQHHQPHHEPATC